MNQYSTLYRKITDLGNSSKLLLIAGPPLIDNKTLATETAQKITGICKSLDVELIFKSAFKHINSTINEEFSGLPAETALKHLKQVGKELSVPVQTDVYNELDVFVASRYVDILQIPAYLFRDTSLLEACAKTGKVVNIRKGMTIRGSAMEEAVQKIRRRGSGNILLTERGSNYGYEDVVVDYRNIMAMSRNNVPVLIDLSSAIAAKASGLSEQDALQTAEILGKAAIAAGVKGIILDLHSNPAMTKKPEGYCFKVSAITSLLEELSRTRKMF